MPWGLIIEGESDAKTSIQRHVRVEAVRVGAGAGAMQVSVHSPPEKCPLLSY